MSIFNFGKKKNFGRNYYGELCEQTRQNAILEDTVISLTKERDDLIRRLSVYEKVEPKTIVNLPQDSKVWAISDVFGSNKTSSILIGEEAKEPEVVEPGISFEDCDVVYDADGNIIHEKNKDSARQTITPITAIPLSVDTGEAEFL